MSRAPQQDSRLDRSIGLWQLVFYGSGTILGAGIFVVVGEVLRVAGALTPFAYALAAVVAITSALSFAEMGCAHSHRRRPDRLIWSARFNMRWLGSGAGWVLMVANTVSAATIVTGFVAYLDSFASVPGWIATVALIIVLGGIAVAGMKESSWLMTVTTLIGITALLAVLWALRDALDGISGARCFRARLGTRAGEAGPVAFSFRLRRLRHAVCRRDPRGLFLHRLR